MSAKSDRSKRTRATVERSIDERALVRITRTIRVSDPTDGVVVAHGIRWLLVNRLSPDLDLDGCTAVRWKHVKKVQPFDQHSLPSRATAGTSPAVVPTDIVDATTTGSLLRSIEATATPVSLHTESTKPPSCTTGRIAGVVAKAVLITLASPSNRPGRHLEVPFEQITRIDFGTRYLAGLARADAWKDRSSDD